MTIPTTKQNISEPGGRRDISGIWTSLMRAQTDIEQGPVRLLFDRMVGGSTESYNAIKVVLRALTEFHTRIDGIRWMM